MKNHDIDSVIAAFASQVSEMVAAKMTAAMETDSQYSSVQLPPDCPSKNRFHQLCRQIPAAQKLGRMWFVPKNDWANFRNRPKQSQVPEIIHESDPVAMTIAKKFRRIG